MKGWLHKICSALGFYILGLCFFSSLSTKALSFETVQDVSSEGVSEKDTTAVSLEEVEITAKMLTPVSKGGSMEFDTKDFYSSFRIMGEADPINYIKRLSGVTTSGDYGSGMMIDGAAPSQALFRINGTPVFFPYRFGGIFSTFNGGHFSKIDFERGIHKGNMPNRLGSVIDFINSHSMPEKVSGDFNVGMMSSSLTLDLPLRQKFRLVLSGRISYVDQVYGPLLKKTLDLGYRFWDLNLNFQWHIDRWNVLEINGFSNMDHLNYNDDSYSMQNILTWQNDLLSLIWTRKGNFDMTHRIHYSGFRDNYEILLPQLSVKAPSSLSMLGAAGDFSHWLRDYTLNLQYGYEFNLYNERPQHIDLTGYNREISNKIALTHPLEARIFGDIRLPLKFGLNFYGGLSVSYFKNQDYESFTLDPRLTLNIPAGPGAFNIHLGKYSQYLHQIGFSQIGLASDFWITSSKDIPKMSSFDLELDYTGVWKNLSFSVTGYIKRVRKEADYIGQVLDILQEDYNPADYIHIYDGFNTGINFTGSLAIQKITAAVGAGYGIARRKDKASGKLIRGNTEPGFTCNLDLNYEINPHWKLGARFRYATGRPYTPIVGLYMLAGNLIKEFGIPNSALFPATHQLDLSATWICESGPRNHKLRHLINLSLINAYGHKNVEIMTYVYSFEKAEISLRKIYSLYRFLPSLSYTLQF